MAGLKVEVIGAETLDEYRDKLQAFIIDHPNARIKTQTQSESYSDRKAMWDITLTIFFYED